MISRDEIGHLPAAIGSTAADTASIVKTADVALCQAKRGGRNRVVMAGKNVNQPDSQHLLPDMAA